MSLQVYIEKYCRENSFSIKTVFPDNLNIN